jgi:N6-L-threonylcarbamoyladenine synthase
MIASGDLDFSFAGLKTAVLTRVRNQTLTEPQRADLAAEFQQAVVDVLAAKCVSAVLAAGTRSLVVAGGVGANRRLRETLAATSARQGFDVFFPEPQFCTDNGAMIAFAGACRLARGVVSSSVSLEFAVHPRWDLANVSA